MHTLLRFALLALVALVTLSATAQPRDSVEGVHFHALAQAVPTEAGPDKIEVRELFWYGCHECSTLEPMMTQWRDGVTGDLVFVRMPAVWNDLMALHARLFYTGGALKAEDRINQSAFRAVQQENKPLRNEAEVEAFFVANGFTVEAFREAWNSEAVTAAVQAARLRTADYSVTKLPSIVLNGRYEVTHNAAVFNHVELNIAVNNVIRKLRVERRADF